MIYAATNNVFFKIYKYLFLLWEREQELIDNRFPALI
jgi:hypothetical protein